MYIYNPLWETKLANVFYCLSMTKQLFIVHAASEQLSTARNDNLSKYRGTFFDRGPVPQYR